MSNPKLVQRSLKSNHHTIEIGFAGNIGYISIEDSRIYPDEEPYSRVMMIPLLTKEDLIDLQIAISEVLKYSK